MSNEKGEHEGRLYREDPVCVASHLMSTGGRETGAKTRDRNQRK